ncbi:hypothetical protein HK405_011795 [Cladochytrium tenue]|nr:hypothetical protein HK405_011795 [Cladochytrium tenue]
MQEVFVIISADFELNHFTDAFELGQRILKKIVEMLKEEILVRSIKIIVKAVIATIHGPEKGVLVHIRK